MSENKPNNEPKFNEALAYEELRMIFAIAIETQDFQTLEARISAWERKYPLDAFIDEEIIRRIKAILNKDFLQRLIGDYLTAKILHEQEKQKEAYIKLKEIIDTAKRTKDYSKAQGQIQAWKNDLSVQNLLWQNFNKYYKAKICTMLLMPSKELEKQEEASKSLKDLVDRSKEMDSESLSLEISAWQNKYTLADFPVKLQTQLNEITTQVFESISQKVNQEGALQEIHEIAKANTLDPLDAISTALAKYDLSKFDSNVVDEINALTQEAANIPTLSYDEQPKSMEIANTVLVLSEVHAISDLKNILNSSSQNLDGLINWIYINRGMDFSELSREEIKKAFYAAGFKVPEQATYSIPEISDHLSYKEFSEIDKIRENVILNYLGLISHGEKLSLIASENISHLNSYKKSSEISTSEKVETIGNSVGQNETKLPEEFSFVLPVFDNEPIIQESTPVSTGVTVQSGALENSEVSNSSVSIGTKDTQDNDEIVIQNIIAEDDLLQDPLETYTIPSPTVQISEAKIPTSQVNSYVNTASPESEIYEGKSREDKTIVHATIQEEPLAPKDISDDVPITINDKGKANLMSKKDEENLAKAHELSTYIIVAAPILKMALEGKHVSKTTKKIKESIDYDIQKNNGF